MQEVVVRIMLDAYQRYWLSQNKEPTLINREQVYAIYNALVKSGYVVKKEEPTKEQLHDAFTKGVNDALFKEPPQADLLEELEKYLDAEISIKLTGLTRLQTLVEIRSKIQELKAKP